MTVEQSEETRKTLKFFVARELYRLLSSENWQSAAEASEFAVVAFGNTVDYANPVFQQHFRVTQQQLSTPLLIEQLLPARTRDRLRSLLPSLHAFEAETAEQFAPVYLPLMDDDGRPDDLGVMAVHPLPAGEASVVLAVWINKHMMPVIAREESLVLEKVPSGLYHATVNLETWAAEAHYISPSMAAIVGEPYERLIAKGLQDPHWWTRSIYNADRSEVMGRQSLLLLEGRLLHEYRIQTPDGTKWIEDCVEIIQQTPQTIDIVGVWTDIDHSKRLELSHEFSSGLYRAIEQSGDEASFYCDLCEQLASVPTIALAWVGLPEPEENPQRILSHVCRKGVGKCSQTIHVKITEDDQPFNLVAEAWRDGFTYHEIARATPRLIPWHGPLDEGIAYSAIALRIDTPERPVAILVLYSDQPGFFRPDKGWTQPLKELRKLLGEKITLFRHQKHLELITYSSPLTGDPNQTALLERLQNIDGPVSLVYLNLKEFSSINLLGGFAQGDEMIRRLSRLLHSHLQEQEEVYHLGADHFFLVLKETRTELLHRSMTQIQGALDELTESMQIPPVRARFSILRYPQDCQDPMLTHEILVLMDHQDQDTNIRFFDPALYEDVENNIRIQSLLRRAIREKRFTWVFQPIADAQHPDRISAEILIRLMDDSGNPVSPERFIRVAEQTQLISHITPLVAECAISTCAQWISTGLPVDRLSINLSAIDIEQRDTLITHLKSLWEKYQVSPRHFAFEITERTAVLHMEKVRRFIHELRDLGATVELDDFGVGHSSLSMLNQLDVAAIKIDKQFVDQMLDDSRTYRLIRLIIDTAHDLGAKTIAEGVETRAQYEALTKLGCDFLQGYYICRPLPDSEFTGFIKRYVANNTKQTQSSRNQTRSRTTPET
ncbi:GGDEF domain-containing phosphodiesterase [Hahella sp. SMD15-11]|uniref:GGDEF domain-containing phosphodiesterase n=1 Tax=Thermohahella caldifontis TaxID=3142973 RepID=A0AB39UTD9_9GAMM